MLDKSSQNVIENEDNHGSTKELGSMPMVFNRKLK